MNRVGLRGQDALGLLLRDPRRKCLMRNRDVLRDISNHIDALLDVLVEQVGAELGIEDAAGKKDERQNQKNRNKSDKQIRNNPARTTNVERRSSHERWFQTSLSIARMGVIGPSMKTILYLNRCKEGSRSTG